MKKVLLLFVFILLSCSFVVDSSAEILMIDVDTATCEEITDMITQLKSIRLQKLTEQFSQENAIQPASTITFRKIPWKTTKKETEAILGTPNSISRSFIVNTRAQAHTSGIGIESTYLDFTVSGYAVTYCKLYYVYPAVDNVLIRDDNLAQLYLAKYDIRELGDVNAALTDIKEKLVHLYGNYAVDYLGDLIWSDASDNKLVLHTWSSCFSLTYYTNEAENLLGAANSAVDYERAENEELLRLQNKNNTDGL